ncbi:MAG: hypothetical protein QOI66_1205 [Myxococcales bacterium]|nr:hypothetical protein [Myxococcales bacterium]
MRPRLFIISVVVVIVSAAASGSPAAPSRGNEQDEIELGDRTTAIGYQRTFHNEDLNAWRKRVPQVRLAAIKSSIDGQTQKVLWYAPPNNTEKKPLLVVLHSWSADFKQNLDIPFAEFCIENNWALIHPDFRGGNRRPEATASDLANQDVIDAVNLARKRTAIDDARIYLVGYSGGAMESLVLAGKHPELWAGVAVWGAIYDVARWYHEDHGKDVHYRGEIAASCGGVPEPGSAAESECRKRSPLTYLPQAAGRVPILIAHGVHDRTVSPHHALQAFNALAAPVDRINDSQIKTIDSRGEIPVQLKADAPQPYQSLFQRAGASLRMARQSQAVTLFLYDGNHDMVYNVAVRWLSEQRRASGS